MDFLVVGHIAKDLLPDGSFSLGGTVTYAAITARNLGLKAGIVTCADSTLETTALLQDIALVVKPSPVTTTFENIYHGHERQQFIRAVAAPLLPEDIPAPWLATPIVHLGPLAQELSPEMVNIFGQDVLLGVTPQGWMRAWDETGRVRHCPWESAPAILARADVVVFSPEDVAFNSEVIHQYARQARIMVVTQNWLGCTVYVRGRPPRRFPAYRVQEVDPTGAGDVFAAAYLIRFKETGDPYAAARFANCVASFSVEGKGTNTIPTRDQVAARLTRARRCQEAGRL